MKTYNYYGNHIPIDPETGMPALPDGMFWRIKKAPKCLDKAFEIQLRKRRRFGTRKIDEAWAEGSADRIRFWAAHIVFQREEEKMIHPAPMHLLGDYPPKKLGDD